MADLVNRVYFRVTANGTGTFTVSTAITGYMTPAQGDAKDKLWYSYSAESDNLSEWEVGVGQYTTSGTTLTRTTVLKSSNGNATVNFTAAPKVALTVLAADLQKSGQILALARGQALL